uniref:Ubiquitin-like domain-containing protein n=1 Tax=Naja naja TaxID=35670 RepID=A0A8C6XWW3_NAJNA
MSHDPSASPVESTSEPKLIRVTLKSSGKAWDCQVDEKSTIAELKNEAGRHFLLSKEQVLLIFAGKILKDQESLLQHGIQSGDMVHVVAKRPELRPNHALQTCSLKTFAQETPQFGRLLSLSGLTKMMVIYKKLPRLAGTVAMPDTSLEADMLDDLQSFRQLFVDIRQVLSSPEVQDELEERMLRHTIETSPSLIQLAKENARVGHLLSNPKVVGEIIRYIQKPEVKQEMDRHCDRILSNIESFPGGYNILQRMYKEIEEPIWSVMEQEHQNPFATQGGSPASNQAVLPPRIENRTPLPDPWVPRQLQTRPQEMGKANHQRGAAEEGNLHPEKVSNGTQVDFSLESSQTEDLPEAPNASPESSTSFLQDGEAPATESPASQAPVLQSQDLTQQVVLNGTTPTWREVSNGVPQGCILGLGLFNIFINDLDEGPEGEFIRFSDETKLAGIVNALEDKVRIQKDLDRLEQWALSSKMKFNVEKKKTRYKYRLGKNSNCERDLGLLVDDDLKMS